MANRNLSSLNVKTLNYTGEYIYHRGKPVATIPVDASGNQHTLSTLGIKVKYGTEFIDGSGTKSTCGGSYMQKMTGDLNVNSRIQIARDPANKQAVTSFVSAPIATGDPQPGQIIFSRDTSGNYGFFGYGQTNSLCSAWGWQPFGKSQSTLSNVWNCTSNEIWYENFNAATKVGIGTSCPQKTLDVSGSLQVSSLSFKNQIGYFESGYGALAFNSTALGYNTQAQGTHSTAMGLHSYAGTDYSTAIGNQAYAGDNIAFAVGTSATFSGIIASSGQNNNRLVIDTSGNVGIGKDTPTVILDVSGSLQVSSLSFKNQLGYFESGYGATGFNSTAMGNSTKASGLSSMAMGASTDASGNYSTAMGVYSYAWTE